MGTSAAETVREIEATRQRLDADLQELEHRLPPPARWAKRIAGVALGGGLAGSRCLEQKKPNYIAGTYNPGFKIDLHFKDLGLIMESARALGVPLPATAVVQELFSALRVKGRGGLDHSGVITLLEDLAGTS